MVDDFGDVYGFLLGVVADGFSDADLERYVDGLRKELSLVKGVARVEVWGVQPECIYLDVSQSRLANAGVSVDQIRNTVQQQNLVVDAGAIDVGNQRVQVATTGMFRTPEDIVDLLIRGGPIRIGFQTCNAAVGGDRDCDPRILSDRSLNGKRGRVLSSLFSMVAISLGFSWIVAITVTPVVGMLMLASREGTAATPIAAGPSGYPKLLTAVLRMRIPVILVFVVLLVGSGMSFRFVNQMFFPNSSRPQFMVDVWLPEGTRIERTSEVLRNLENLLGKKPEIQSIAAFIGQGPPRFYLPVEPEKPYSSYGQLIVSLKDFRDAQKLMHRSMFRQTEPGGRGSHSAKMDWVRARPGPCGCASADRR